MRPEIKRGNAAAEFETAERCAITEVANDAADEQVSIARATVRPGATTAWHKLDGIDERYLIIAGQGCVELEGLRAASVSVGDVVRIPAGAAQRITNTGSTDLVLYAICSPRFQASCYIALE